ncbi:MAG: GlsB/YeaQ/YmgE family stress response membrane protein [bacterium]
MNLLLFLVIGLAAGWLAGQVMKGRGFGLIGNLIVGIVGAFVGGFLFGQFGLEAYTFVGSLVSAFVGALILLWIVGMVKKT